MAAANAETTLPEALESIAGQTYRRWELVACDDGSADGTLNVLENFKERFPDRVTVIRNASTLRLAASLNRCLERTSGELIARMDSDDRCAPERLERQVRFLKENPEYAVVGTAVQRFDEAGFHDVLMPTQRPDRWSLRRGVPFAHATIMMRREAYEVLNGYTVARRTIRGQDVDLWFRFFAAGLSGANLLEPLYFVREDRAAIRRRTVGARLGEFCTRVIGFRLLRYPLRWYIYPLAELLKIAVPTSVVVRLRKHQAKRFVRHHAAASEPSQPEHQGFRGP